MALGREEHTVFITDRGGKNVVGQVPKFNLVRWNRVRDDISDATVAVPADDPKCCELLSEVRSGRHEMVIYRGDKRVWEGPITRPSYSRTQNILVARDVMHYPYRAICKRQYSNAYPNIGPVTERAKTILTTELARFEALSPPIDVLPYLDVRTNHNTARTSRKTLPYQVTAWEDVDALAAKSGLDYTVIGRRIVMNDTHDVIGRTQTMTDADFQGDIIVTEYGMELSTFAAVTDGFGHYGHVGGKDDYYGIWEILATAYEETPVELVGSLTPAQIRALRAELIDQADRNRRGRYPAPLVVRVPDNSPLNPDTTALTIDDLVPGIRIPLRTDITCRTITQEQKLDSVRCEATDSGETFTVTISPAPGVIPDSLETGADGID